jgi:nucleoside-diphosphate-sugar epimerase
MAQALYADEITVGALDPVRDMNYVGDTVAGFLGAASADGVEGNVYNVGSGEGYMIGEILEQVRRVAGTDKPVRREEERVRPAKSEVGRLVCDYSRAAAAFGYAPSVSLAQGLEQVRDFLLAHPPADDSTVYRV